MMTSQTGNNQFLPSKKFFSSEGFTFVEVMVSVLILSFGITMIFKSYLVHLDYTEHLTNRFYATNILDNRISDVQRSLTVYKALPFELNNFDEIDLGGKKVRFYQEMDFRPVDEFLDVFLLQISLKWTEGKKEKRITRAAYVSDFRDNK